MGNHKKSILLVVLLLLVAIATAYVGGTYAKYTESFSREAKATVAKWNFVGDNEQKTLAIDFSEKYDATTLVDGKIAPGTSGSFKIKLTNDTTETGVNFILALGDVSNLPTNLKFYKDSAYKTEITPNGETTITGQLKAKDATGVEVPLYWKWEYETKDTNNSVTAGDTADTTNGKDAQELTVPVTITGNQVSPSTTAITSHID